MTIRERIGNFFGSVFAGAIARAMSVTGYASSRPEASGSADRATALTFPAASAGTLGTSVTPRAIGGRVSVDDASDAFAGAMTSFAAFTGDQSLRSRLLDPKALERLSPSKLGDLLADLSPEVSRALFDAQLMCNPGVEIDAFRPGTENSDPRAKKELDAMRAVLKATYGSEDVVYDQLFNAIYLRGGVAGELVLDLDGREFIDIARPDPSSLSFRKAVHPVRGVVWQVGQWQKGIFVVLSDLETFRYVPLHPLPGRISGRAPFAPAFFVAVFLMQVLRDLRRVISQQGFDKTDVTVQFDKLRPLLSADVQNNPEALQSVAEGVIDAVKSVLSNLEPDDQYVHTDAVVVNRAPGAASSSTISSVDALFKALERMATRALKTMPLNMATTDGVSEANANRQWEMYAAGVKSIQHRVEHLLEYLFSLALQAKGILATVRVRFSELRTAEELRDEMAREKKINNARMLYDDGVISQNERAKLAHGKDIADQQTPRKTSSTATQTTKNEPDPEPGANRSADGGGERRALSTTQVETATEYWQHIAPDEARDLPAAEAVN